MDEHPSAPPPPDGPATRSHSGSKPRFAPNLSAAATRRTARTAAVEAPTTIDLSATSEGNAAARPPPSTLSRGRGRGRGGLLRMAATAGRAAGITNANSVPVASGPFAQGPASIRSARSAGARGVSMVLPPTAASSLPGYSTSTRHPLPLQDLADSAATNVSGEEQHHGLEELVRNRTAGQHLPISLSVASDTRKKRQPAGTAVGTKDDDRSQQDPVVDDTFVDSREIVNSTGQLMLFQLPACLPIPAVGASAELGTIGTSGSTGLLEGPLAAVSGEGEKILDLDTFQTIQEQQRRSQQQASQVPKWPVGAEGLLGRLRVHASGRVSLLINEVVWRAMASSYRLEEAGGGQQRVVAIDTDYQQSFDLGPLTSHCVFIPDHL